MGHMNTVILLEEELSMPKFGPGKWLRKWLKE
jgi:hypothetical protein